MKTPDLPAEDTSPGTRLVRAYLRHEEWSVNTFGPAKRADTPLDLVGSCGQAVRCLGGRAQRRVHSGRVHRRDRGAAGYPEPLCQRILAGPVAGRHRRVRAHEAPDARRAPPGIHPQPMERSMTTTTVTLTRDQIRFMELVYRGEGEDGWSPIGKMTLASARHASYQMPHLPPPDMMILETFVDGTGRARLTDLGRSIMEGYD